MIKNSTLHCFNAFGLFNFSVNKLFLFFFLFFCTQSIFSQYSTKHYIAAAPWDYSSNANEFIVSSASGTASVTVTKSDGTAITTLSVTSGTPVSFRPTGAPATRPANAINTIYNDRGLIFTSTSPIAVSVRNVESDAINGGRPTEIKGNSSLSSYGNEAIGSSFRVGYYRSNFTGLFAYAPSGFPAASAAPVYSVMAIDNNTVVSVNGSALVTLNAGQSYLFQSAIGSLVTASKPVVMNSGQWRDQAPNCGDAVLNQIPPIRVLGTNYLVVRGNGTSRGTSANLNFPEQTIFIATEDNTTVVVNTVDTSGAITATNTYTLSTAGSFQSIFHGIDGVRYSASVISSDKKIMVYSGTAEGCEVDMACVAPVSSCTGSFRVETKKFTHYNNNDLPYFGYVLINSATEKVFMNGADLETIAGTRRQIGTSGFYLIDFTNIQLSNPTDLVFTSAVRMSISMVQQGGGFSMASYLSSYNDNSTQQGPPTLNGAGCVTALTAEPGLAPYQWYLNDVLILGATSQTYVPTETGSYSVAGTKACGLSVASTPYQVNCIPIDAVNDGSLASPFATVISGSTLATSVKANDLLDGIAVTASNTTVTPKTQGPLKINAAGIITVESGTVNGVYSIEYELCSTGVTPTICDKATAYVRVTVLPGSIAANQTICSGGNPAAFTSTASATGVGTITYRWESAVSPFSTWSVISGATSETYDVPAGLNATTRYRRIAITTLGESDPTAFVTVTVTPLNTIAAGSNQTVCINSPITNITLATTGATGATFSGLPTGVSGAWSGNVVTISGIPSVAGTFNYTVNTTGGCTPASTSGIITVNPRPAQPTVTVTAATCASAASNVLSVYDANLTYTSTPSGLIVGASGVITGGIDGTSYTITATNASNCSATTASFTYNGGGILATPSVPTVTVTAATCASAASNVLSVYDANLTYTSTPSGLIVGASGVITGGIDGTSYTITATNASNCSATTASFTYNGGALLATPSVPTVTVTAATCASAASNVLSVYDANLTYTSTPSGLIVGASGVITGGIDGTSYTITATNASNCSATTASFTYNGGALLATPSVPTVTVTAATCASAASNVLSVYDANLTYTSTPSGLIVGASGVITGGIDGTSYTITATNASNCSATTASFTYNGGALLATPSVPTVTVTAATCASAASNVLSVYDANLTYTSTPSGLIVGASGVITGGIDGTSYTITATNASNCSATTASFTYNGGALLATPSVPTVTVTAATCASAASNVLSVYDANLTYTSTPSGLIVGASGVITGGIDGTSYTITATNASNCSATTASFTYNGGALLATPSVPTVTVTAATCASAASNVLSVYDANLTYTSTPSGLIVGASGVITGGIDGTSYTITATNASNCSATTASFTYNGGALLATPSVPTVTVTAATCASAASNVLSVYDANLTYTSTPSGLIVGASGVITGGIDGTSYTITATNASNCSATTASFTYNGGALLATPSVPTVTVTAATCASAASNVLSVYDANLTYTSTPSGLIVGASGVITGGIDGTSYTITATNASNCSATTASFTYNGGGLLATPSVPTVDLIIQPTCTVATGSVVLSGLPSGNWIINPGNITGNTTSITITGLAVGTTFNYTVTNSFGCISLASADIFISNLICANDDTIASTGGNVLSNDTLNGLAVTTSNTDVTPVTTGPLRIDANGNLTVAPNTPSGTYTITYELCEVGATPANCDTAVATVVVANPIVAIDDTIASTGGNVLSNDILNGLVVTTSNTDVTPVTTGPLRIDANGNLTVAPNTPSGTYTITYELCEVGATPANCDTAVATVVVANPIVANDDTIASTGGNVLSNDILNGLVVTTSNTDVTPVTTGPLRIDANGNLTVAPNTPSGTYTITYELCEVGATPANCDTAVATVVVNTIDAVDDGLQQVVSLFGKTINSVLLNDTFNGVLLTPATYSTVSLSGVTVPTGFTLNSDGSIDVAPGTPIGTYTIVYQICTKSTPVLCDQATVVIEIQNLPAPAPPVVFADDDTVGSIDGSNGAKNVISILSNDFIDLTPATINNVNISIITPDATGSLILNPDGSVDVKAGTPAGTYSFVYSICTKNTPVVCDQATVTVTVICNTTKISGVVRDLLNNRPLANVPVTLIPDKQTTGPVLLMLTKADGSYNFTGFTPGDYIIQVQDVNLNSAQNLYNVGPSIQFLNIQKCIYEVRNFDYDKTDLPVLGNFVWYDINSNGLQDEWYDANNDGVVTQNIPDANGYIDYSKWEWIDYNGDGKYTGKENEGEINAAGLGNGTTNVPNIYITGPNGFSRQITMSIQGYWRSRAPQGNWGDYQVSLVMESNLEAAAQAKSATGLIKVLPTPLNRSITDKSAAVQSFVVCGVTTNSTKNTQLSVVNPVDDKLDFGIQCKLFATIVANNDPVGPIVSSTSVTTNVINVLANDTFNGAPLALANVNLTTVNTNPNLRLNTDGTVDVVANTPAGTYVLTYQICEKANPSNCQTATVTVTVVAPVIVATNDDYSNQPIDSSKGTVLDILANDRLNNGTVSASQVVITIVDANGIAGVTVDAQGKITIPAGTPVGTYVLTYRICDVVNTNNCATATITIVVKDPCDFDDSASSCDILIHNAFSPNNDGRNEVFVIERIENYPENTVEIYNRWGVLVFEVSGYDNASKVFVGLSEGRVTVNKADALPNGTYYYVVKYKKPISGAINQKAGYLYLSR